MKRIRIFAPADERLNLFLPFLFSLPIAWELMFHSAERLSPSLKALFTGLAATVLLNATHVGFTFSTALTLPQAKGWIASLSGGARRFWVLSSLLMGFFFAIFLFGLGRWGTGLAIAVYAPWVFVINNVLLDYHALGQSKGLSLLYNRKLLQEPVPDPTVLKKIRIAEKTERLGILILFSLIAIAQLGPKLGIHQALSVSGGRFVDLSCAVMWIVIAAVFLAQFLLPRSARFPKQVFLLRLLIWPLEMYSFFAIFALLSIHGLEYFFVYRRVQARPDPSKKWVRWGFAGLAFVLGCCQLNGFPSMTTYRGPLLAAATALIAAMTIFHIAWDRVFYRMRTATGDTVAFSFFK